MYKALFYTHQIVVTLFLLIYLIKTALLLANKKEQLAKIVKALKVPEMIISFTFLATGIYLLTQAPEINKFMVIKLVCVFASIPIAIIGFKKENKALAALAFLLIVAAYGLAEVSKKRGYKTAPTEATTMDGKTLYSANCARCHGEDGKLGAAGAADLSASTMDAGAAAAVIREGKGAMAGFKGAMSEEQINAVAGYVEGLRK